MTTITHALAKAGGRLALCGARKNLILGGAFKGKVTCAECLNLHQQITKKRPKTPSKPDPWGLLNHLINVYVEAAIEDSWKGGGNTEDYDVKELREKLARMKLTSHIEKMQRELL